MEVQLDKVQGLAKLVVEMLQSQAKGQAQQIPKEMQVQQAKDKVVAK